MKRRAFSLFILPFITLLGGCASPEAMTFSATLVLSPRVTAKYETFYSDRYFFLDPTEYHQELALISHAMTLAAFPVENFKEDYALQPGNLKAFWKSIGFSDTWCCQNYYEEAETDSIGFAFANKKITDEKGIDYTVIAIAIRGNDYGAEWASNFTLGEFGDAQGFSEASTAVLLGLKDYVELRAIKGRVKFWTSGYSRAAITANMVAGELNYYLQCEMDFFNDQVSYEQKDVIAYCFEPPMGVVDNYEDAHTERYANIHNMLNLNDLVPLVAPDEWGFTRYGVDHYYPDRLTDIHFDEKSRRSAITRYHYTPNGTNLADYTIDDWTFVDVGTEFAKANNLPRASVHPSQALFIRDLIRNLAYVGFTTRESYTYSSQNAIRRLFTIINGRDTVIKKSDITMDGLIKLFFECNLINVMLTELLDGDVPAFVLDMEPLFYQAFGGPGITVEDARTFYLQCISLLSSFASGFTHRQDLLTQFMHLPNLMNLKLAHSPELSYAWLGSCDPRYYGEEANELNDGSYYLFAVMNATHVRIYERNFGRVIFESDGEKMKSDILSATSYGEGTYEICLPKNGSYQFAIEGENANGFLVDIDARSNKTILQSNITGEGTIN